MYGTAEGCGADENSGKCYEIRVTKMGYTITRTKRHIKTTPITAEDYLRNDVSKTN